MATHQSRFRAVIALLFGFVITATCGTAAMVGAAIYWRYYAIPPLICLIVGWAHPLWPIIWIYSVLLQRIPYQIARLRIHLPQRQQLRSPRGVLQVAILNHPDMLRVPVPLIAVYNDCGPLKIIVKAMFVLWPFIGWGGFAMGGFAPIARLKAQWAQWFNRLVAVCVVVVCERTRTTLAALIDQHRPTQRRRRAIMKATAHAPETGLGQMIRSLHTLLPPRAGILWLLLDAARSLGYEVRFVGYFTHSTENGATLDQADRLCGTDLTVERVPLTQLSRACSREELQELLNAIWLEQDAKMSQVVQRSA